MHEAAIAENLLEQLLAQAAAHDVTSIDAVELRVGALEGIVPEALAVAFEAAAAESVASGAELRLEEVPPRARCRACGHDFEPARDDFRCPACGEAAAEITAGRGIILQSIHCATV